MDKHRFQIRNKILTGVHLNTEAHPVENSGAEPRKAARSGHTTPAESRTASRKSVENMGVGLRVRDQPFTLRLCEGCIGKYRKAKGQ